MPGLNKDFNEYAALIENYDQIPKSVLAAIAVSFAALQTGSEDFTQANAMINDEWAILNANGIVPQKPRKALKARGAK